MEERINRTDVLSSRGCLDKNHDSTEVNDITKRECSIVEQGFWDEFLTLDNPSDCGSSVEKICRISSANAVLKASVGCRHVVEKVSLCLVTSNKCCGCQGVAHTGRRFNCNVEMEAPSKDAESKPEEDKNAEDKSSWTMEPLDRLNSTSDENSVLKQGSAMEVIDGSAPLQAIDEGKQHDRDLETELSVPKPTRAARQLEGANRGSNERTYRIMTMSGHVVQRHLSMESG